MGKITVLLCALMLVVTFQPAMAAADSKKTSSNSPQQSQDQSHQEKSEKQKSSETMEKAGNSVKSGWQKFTKSVKQGAKKSTCTPQQKTLKQC